VASRCSMHGPLMPIIWFTMKSSCLQSVLGISWMGLSWQWGTVTTANLYSAQTHNNRRAAFFPWVPTSLKHMQRSIFSLNYVIL
jgi:hypothetical protein